MAQQPIIIIGMHRSGTTMITDILEKLGLFMGSRQNIMQEARFFLNINRWILRHTGGSWIRPETVDSLLEDPQARQHVKHVIDFMAFVLRTPRTIEYMGLGPYLKYHQPAHLPTPWGWKDPRTTFTLPLWLGLFPEARVIHIYRNGVDVANSLYTRSQKGAKRFAKWQHAKRRWRYALRPAWFPGNDSYYVPLIDGHRLWETYTRRADDHIASLPPTQTRVICYEMFLHDPVPVLHDLCNFIGLSYEPDHLAAAIESLDPTRSYAFKDDPALTAFYQDVKSTPQMVKYGYDQIVP